MPREKEMRADRQAMRAYVENDPLIIALKSPAMWLCGIAAAIAAVGCVHLACRAAATMAGLA